MKENKTLLSYILGACTIVIFLPIVEELVNVYSGSVVKTQI